MEMIEIEAFVTIARTGSFTRAATELGISQPAVSRRIDLLEHELGMPLFERIHSGARLTAAGEAFLPHASRTLAAVRDGIAAVDSLARGDRGTVSLALVGTLASTRLAGTLRRFREEHPDIHMQVRTARSAEVSDMVQRGEVTLGLRYFEDPSNAIVSTHIDDENLVVVCAADSELASATSADHLAEVTWVSFPIGAGSSGDPFTRVLKQTLAAAGLDEPEFLAIDSLTAQKRMIEAGFGVGMMPASSIEEEVRLGTLTVPDIPALRASVPVMLLYRREGFISPAARRLCETLTRQSG